MTTQSTGGSLSTTRRTLVKGAAWSVPVVAMGSAAPAMAASQEVVFNNLGLACKSPGASCGNQNSPDPKVVKGYYIRVNVCTDVRGTVTIDFGTAMVSLDGAPATSGWTLLPDPLVISYSGETGTRCQSIVLGVSGEPNSKNVSILGSAPFTWTSSNNLSGSGTLNFSAPSTPPCPDCAVVPVVQPPAA
jgi:hypothetical protein